MSLSAKDTKRIYFDYNATTPLLPEVIDAMLPHLRENFGNPSSAHWYGQQAKEAVDMARAQVAKLINCQPDEIVITSGGSESNNQAVKGVVEVHKKGKNHIITSSIEHPAMKNPCGYLENCRDCSVTYLPVDKYGVVNPTDVERAINENTVLISIMYANNEVGTIQPIAEIGEVAAKNGICFHSDAAQAVGKIPVTIDKFKIDLMTICAHKFYGPKGVGALYLRRGTKVHSLIHGSGHERGLRAGTENVASIVGMGKAAEIAENGMVREAMRIGALRDAFFEKLSAKIKGVVQNGHPIKRLPGTLHVSFDGVNGSELLDLVPEICATTGAACSDRAKDISGVLKAMGLSRELGMGSVRFSLGKYNTMEEIDYAVNRFVEAVKELRSR